eukprot:687060-Amorphochlora_amoeboformis.AAC.1
MNIYTSAATNNEYKTWMECATVTTDRVSYNVGYDYISSGLKILRLLLAGPVLEWIRRDPKVFSDAAK